MDPRGENPRKLVTAPESNCFNFPIWSPDSRRIAYKRADFRITARSDIEVQDLEGGKPVRIISDLRISYEDFWWTRDNRLVFSMMQPKKEHLAPTIFASDLWSIKVEPNTGKALGPPVRATHWPGVEALLCSGTADGKRLAVLKQSVQADIYIGELEIGKRQLKNQRQLTFDEGNEWAGSWSPDSKFVFFSSDRNGQMDIFKQALDQETAQPIATGPGDKIGPVPTPDGIWILYQLMGESWADPRLMRVPIRGGSSELVTEMHGGGVLHGCGYAPGSLCDLNEPTPDYKEWIVTAVDPLAGRGRELGRFPVKQPYTNFNGATVSPDGSKIAIVQNDPKEDRIVLVSTAGGRIQEVVLKRHIGVNSVWWASNGDGFIVASYFLSGNQVCYVDMEGRVDFIYAQKNPWHRTVDCVPSPDGRYLAMTRWIGDANVWLLENF